MKTMDLNRVKLYKAGLKGLPFSNNLFGFFQSILQISFSPTAQEISGTLIFQPQIEQGLPFLCLFSLDEFENGPLDSDRLLPPFAVQIDLPQTFLRFEIRLIQTDGAVEGSDGLIESFHSLVHPCLPEEDIYIPHIDQLRPPQPMKGILIMALLEGDLRKPEIEIDLGGVSF
jgi:hypothetical protein